MEIVLETATPDGISVVLPALVYAKVLEEHAAVGDLDLNHRDRVLCRPPRRLMEIATVHIFAADLGLTGSYDPTGDVLYLSAPGDDKTGAAQETPEGHAVRLDREGRITHLTAINAKWLLDRDGELIATLRHGRQLRLTPPDVATLLA